MTLSVQHFRELTASLGQSFEERARAHDQEARFVADNYRELRQNKFFSAAVPAELGGGGLSHRELGELIRQLGWYCGSTALAFSMHSHLVAAAVWRHRHGMPGEALLRKVAQSELVLVSTGAGDWVDSVGESRRVSGGYRVSGVKRFCSGGPMGDLLITSAPFVDTTGADEVLHFPVSLRAEGVRPHSDWDTLGMRATGSHSIELVDVFIPEEAIVLRRPRGRWHRSWDVVVANAAPIYVAAYVGIAERAVELARTSLAQRGPDDAALCALGEAYNELASAELAWRDMLAITDDYAVEPSAELSSRMLIRKTLLANAVRASVEKAAEATGGSAFFRSNPLERLWRDAQGVTFHPLPEKKQLAFTARVALGLPPLGE
jgi:alkylation response protein AidB-like acyl-CoA dehydrogenase